MVKNLLIMQEIQVQSLGWEDPMEKEMAAHFTILAWRILLLEEPGGLQCMGCKDLDMTKQLILLYFFIYIYIAFLNLFL